VQFKLTPASGLLNIMKSITEKPMTITVANIARNKNVFKIWPKMMAYKAVSGNPEEKKSRLIHPRKSTNIPTCHCHCVGHPHSLA